MGEQTLPPRYEHPPAYSKIANRYRPQQPRDEPPTLPPFAAAHSERPIITFPSDPDSLRRVHNLLVAILFAERETFNAYVDDIAALWTVDNGHGPPVRTYCKLTFKRVFGEELGCVIWDEVDSCEEDEGQMHVAASARLAILGS